MSIAHENAVLGEALRLAPAFGIFPVKADKHPAYQVGKNAAGEMAHNDARKGPTGVDVAQRWFDHKAAWGIAVWCGDLQCIDFDDPAAAGEWFKSLKDHGLDRLLERCVRSKTRNGYHVWCLVPGCEIGNQKLARFAEPIFDNARGKEVSVRVETRGLGGYAILPPTVGYRWLKEGADLTTLEPLTEEEFDDLLAVARLLDQRPVPDYVERATQSRSSASEVDGPKPGDWFNQAASWRELLEAEGARYLRSHGERDYWVRPGKTSGVSATTGNGRSGQDLLVIHSSNWPGLDEGTAVDKFGFYARTKFGGGTDSLSLAAKEIAKRSDFPKSKRKKRERSENSSSSSQPIEQRAAAAIDDGIDVIQTYNRPVRDYAADGIRALAKMNDPPSIFVRSDLLYDVRKDKGGVSRLDFLTDRRLKARLEDAATWQTYKEKQGDIVCPCPKDAVSYIAEQSPWPQFPELKHFAQTPVLVAHGDEFRLLESSGYDQETAVFVAPCTVVQWERTPQEAAEWVLTELFLDFPFEDEASRTHALAMFLTGFVRPAINDTTPLFLLDGSTAGAGKSKLVRVALYGAFGGISSSTMPRDEDKMKSQITTWLRSGSSSVLIDNVRFEVKSQHLESVLTSTEWEDRAYYTQTSVRVPNNAVWAMTSNNGGTSPDLSQRAVLIRLVPLVEDPDDLETRTFRNPKLLEQWVPRHRAQLIGAAIAMMRAWLEAGCPDSLVLHGRHSEWSRIVGGILDVCVVRHFLANTKKLRENNDTETPLWKSLISTWVGDHKAAPMTANQMNTAFAQYDWYENLLGNPKRSAVNTLGALLRGKLGKVFNGRGCRYQIEKGKYVRGTQTWTLKPLGPAALPLPPSSPPGAFDDSESLFVGASENESDPMDHYDPFEDNDD